jgi:hypothetical protein
MDYKDLEEKFKNIKIEDSNIFTINELVFAFEYLKKTRDQYIKENKIDKAREEQDKKHLDSSNFTINWECSLIC